MIPKQDGRESKKHPSATSKSWERHVPFDFTGYTVHIEITERSNDGEITHYRFIRSQCVSSLHLLQSYFIYTFMKRDSLEAAQLDN